jgi:hypothetical protein
LSWLHAAVLQENLSIIVRGGTALNSANYDTHIIWQGSLEAQIGAT